MNTTSHRDWDELLSTYPTAPADFQAQPHPLWDDLSPEVVNIHPKGSRRSTYRYRKAQSQALYYDAYLENIGFTEPEVRTLIDGGNIAGKSAGEIAQIRGMIQASDFMLARVEEGVIEPGQAISDDIHMFIGVTLPIHSVAFRGDQSEQYLGPRVYLGRQQQFRALDARLTHPALDDGLARIKQIEHPVLRGVAWAAFATYHQFYFDGNKRAARYTMNAVLMSHGYDAILIANTEKAAYEDALVESYKTGDLTPHMRFLLDQYDDS